MMNSMVDVLRSFTAHCRLPAAHRKCRALRVASSPAEILEVRVVLTTNVAPSYIDFLPSDYVPGPDFATDPVYQQAIAQWQQAFGAWVAQNGSVPPTPSTSWLNNYANSFNNTLGSGWSNTVGGAISSSMTESWNTALAGASDTALLGATTAVSIPAGFALLYGGEIILGVGTFGAAPLLGAAGEIAAAEAQIAVLDASLTTLAMAVLNGTMAPAEAMVIAGNVGVAMANYQAYINFMKTL